ncbi:MAG: DUF1015 domain-containing protein [Anaerolineae bacterium]
MVEMLPFRGVRYAPDYARPEVFAPPYDVISQEMRSRYTALSPYNITHIDVTPEHAGVEWYPQAAEKLNSWRNQAVLVSDSEPTYYGYVQYFNLPDGSAYARYGLFALVRLANWGDGIYRHEFTRAAPRADRLNLMRATKAQLSPVFGMLHDPHLQLRTWLQPPEVPAVDYVDAEGTRQVFWPITETGAIEAIRSFLAAKEIVIADGHHRYETALAYRDERRAAGGNPAVPQPYDYVLMYVTALQDPGLCILPTHRVVVVPDLPLIAQLRDRLARNFDVSPAAPGQTLEQQIRPLGEESITLGAYLGRNNRWICKLRNAKAPGTAGQADKIELDVAVLQNLILEPILGINAEVLKGGDRVFYTISESEACARVDSGQAQAAFILNPTRLDQVWNSARMLQTMPQKSTYFYPKLLTGLVIHSLQID